jgi:G:T-mismatch repair DNA endonuclease (very short patch repair protein)
MCVKHNIEIKCDCCGTIIITNNSRIKNNNHYFCNRDCRSKWQASDKNPQRKNRKKVCLNCNEVYDIRERKGGSVQMDKQKFCSSKCYGEYNKNNPGVLYKSQESFKVLKVCEYCEKEFLTHRYRDQAGVRFCSTTCHDNSRRETVTCKCCKTEFVAAKWEKRKYCSVKCAKNRIIQMSSGEKQLTEFLIEQGFTPEQHNIIYYNAGNNFYIPDIIVGDNIIIEFYGSYWHCSTTLFQPEEINESIGMTAEQKWKNDENRINLFKSKGYNVLIIWEHDWKEKQDELKKEILTFLEKNNEKN